MKPYAWYPDPIRVLEQMAVDVIRSRMRCRVLALELQMIMGRNPGRIAAWCCRLYSLNPRNPGYETMLRFCKTMALAGWL